MTEFEATHTVPSSGLAAFASPSNAQPAAATLDPWLEVRAVETHGAWTHIVCSNGWSAWVIGADLVSRPSADLQPIHTPTAPQPRAASQPSKTPERNPPAAPAPRVVPPPVSRPTPTRRGANTGWPLIILGVVVVAIGWLLFNQGMRFFVGVAAIAAIVAGTLIALTSKRHPRTRP